MNEAITTLTQEIEKQRTELTQLEEEKRKLEAKVPVLRANLEALTRSLNIIQRKPVGTSTEQTSKKTSSAIKLRKGSMNEIAYLFLKKEGATRIVDLFERVKSQLDPGVKRNSFSSGLYGMAKQNKVFKIDTGKISLLKEV